MLIDNEELEENRREIMIMQEQLVHSNTSKIKAELNEEIVSVKELKRIVEKMRREIKEKDKENKTIVMNLKDVTKKLMIK